MTVEWRQFSKVLLFISLGSVVAVGVNYCISYYRFTESIKQKQVLYDSKLQNSERSWFGPKIGEAVPYTRLTDFNGINPRGRFDGDLMIFLVINPSCSVCHLTGDQMKEVEQFAITNSIGFFVVSFNKDVLLQDILVFRDSMGLTAEVFAFDGYEKEISPQTVGLQYPAYILTDRNGVILRLFIGSHSDIDFRRELTEQLKKETLSELAFK